MPAFCEHGHSQAEADRDPGGSRRRLSRRENSGTPDSTLLRDRRSELGKRLAIFTASTCGSWGAPGAGRAGGEGLMQVVARVRSPDSMPPPQVCPGERG